MCTKFKSVFISPFLKLYFSISAQPTPLPRSGVSGRPSHLEQQSSVDSSVLPPISVLEEKDETSSTDLWLEQEEQVLLNQMDEEQEQMVVEQEQMVVEDFHSQDSRV